jgi:hypothetical protein
MGLPSGPATIAKPGSSASSAAARSASLTSIASAGMLL